MSSREAPYPEIDLSLDYPTATYPEVEVVDPNLEGLSGGDGALFALLYVLAPFALVAFVFAVLLMGTPSQRIERLTSPNERMAAWSCGYYANHPELASHDELHRAIPLVIPHLDSPVPYIRESAADALGAIRGRATRRGEQGLLDLLPDE